MQLTQAVEGFMDGFFSTRRRSEKTRTAYKTDLAQLQRTFGDEQSISMIDADSLEKWAGDLRSRGYAPVSIRRKFATVRVLFAYWVRKGILDSSPLWKIRMDLGRQRLLPRSLTETDVKSLIEYMWRDTDCARVVLTSPSFCTSCSERVYITASGCEIGFGGAQGLQAAGAGGL